MLRKVNLVALHSLKFKVWQRPMLRKPRKYIGNFCREGELMGQGWEAGPRHRSFRHFDLCCLLRSTK